MDNLEKIFRAYDVRGIYPDEINEDLAYKIGRAIAKFLKAKEIVVGRDNRSSSEGLFKLLSEGIRDQGADVIDIGLSTTPMFYWAVVQYGYKGGIMITASHNPAEYNGFKIVKKQAMPVAGDSGLKKIKKLVVKDKFKDKNRGQLKKKEVLSEYIENILKFSQIKKIKPFEININTGEGTAELVISELLKKIPVQRTLSREADLGVIFDKDGDRILFIDEKRQKINPDLITALLVRHFFKKSGKILYTVVASRLVREEIEKTGNKAVCSRVGHTFIQEKMAKEKIIFGAESSGHYYLKDNHYLDSPLFVLLKVLELLSKERKPLSELIKPFDKYFQKKIDFPVEEPEKLLKNIKKTLIRQWQKGKISKIDGLTIEYPDWWFNLRPSNTEPFLRLALEVKTEELLKEKIREVTKLIPSFS
jgi:phosphomannomutase